MSEWAKVTDEYQRKVWDSLVKSSEPPKPPTESEILNRKIEYARSKGVPESYLMRRAAGEIGETEATRSIAPDSLITVLSGGVGCGKTVAAGNWIFEGYGDSALFLTAARLARWGRYNEQAMEKLLCCKRLVVDDLGAEYLDEKGAYLSLLDEVINERYAHKLHTVLTTNLDAGAFKSRYGERIADRIREDGKFLSVGATSMREKA